MGEQIEYDAFARVDMRVGTVVGADLNAKARKPAYVLTIDFGEIGTRLSSAQITDHYSISDLIGQQVVCVVNFGAKHVAGVRSEVLVLGAITDDSSVVLLQPTMPVPPGSPIA